MSGKGCMENIMMRVAVGGKDTDAGKVVVEGKHHRGKRDSKGKGRTVAMVAIDQDISAIVADSNDGKGTKDAKRNVGIRGSLTGKKIVGVKEPQSKDPHPSEKSDRKRLKEERGKGVTPWAPLP